MKNIDSARFADVIETPVATARTLTGDGYLTAPATLARAGVFTYAARELGIKHRPPTSLVKVYRSADELAKAVESFESQTITLDHKWTTAANWRANAIGDVRDVEMNGDAMAGVLIVRDADAIKAIDQGKSQLSNGYSARLIHRPGKFEGQDYEFEQIDFHGNHIAIVDAARCGPECRVGDSAVLPPENSTKENAMSVQRSYDGLTVTLENEQSGQVVDRLMRDLGDTKKALEDEKGRVIKFRVGDKDMSAEEINALVIAKDGEITALKTAQQTPEQIHALVVDRSNAISAAREMVPDIKLGDGDDAHKIHVLALEALVPKSDDAKAMLDAALGSVKLADAKPEVVSVAFATIAAGLKRAKDARRVSDSRGQVGSLATATATGDAKDPRTAYIDRLAHAHEKPVVEDKKGVN